MWAQKYDLESFGVIQRHTVVNGAKFTGAGCRPLSLRHHRDVRWDERIVDRQQNRTLAPLEVRRAPRSATQRGRPRTPPTCEYGDLPLHCAARRTLVEPGQGAPWSPAGAGPTAGRTPGGVGRDEQYGQARA